MKLNEFRLETYTERSLLQWALIVFKDERKGKLAPEEAKTLFALMERVAETQCQPGGCEICCDPAK